MGRSRKQKTIFLVVFGATAIANCWYRGPVFGIMPFLIFALPFVCLVAVFLSYVRVSRRVAPILGVIGGVAISYIFCAPPNTSRLFRIHLGTPVPEGLRELRRWNDNWARDPAYYVRFYATEATVADVVASARMVEAESAGLMVAPARFLLRVPDWWKPEEITQPHVWQNRMGAGVGIALRFDPQSGLAYLVIVTL